MTDTTTTSLRERKRAETWSLIHHAAADMTLDEGLGAVTADKIAGQADVSCRTFFNYFNTKEDAILGLKEPAIADEVRADFDLSTDVLDGVSALLLTVAHSVYGGRVGSSRRFEILGEYPELIRCQLAYMGKVESLVMDLLDDRLERSGWQVPGVPTADAAHVMVKMSGAALRFALEHKPQLSRAEQFEATKAATDIFRKTLRKVL